MTELTLPIMDADYARRLTERIRLTATNARESLTKLQGLVEEAQQGQAHIALGYRSWTAYLADVFGDAPMLLPRDERREVVQWLASEGMSTRAIAQVVETSRATVARQVAGVSNGTPAPAAPTLTYSEGAHRAESVNRGIAYVQHEREAEREERRTVTGMDGKTYTRPAPKLDPPRRPPLPPQVQSAGWELEKAIERLSKLASDDRFAAHKTEMAPHLRSHLTSAIEVCQDLLNRINN